MLFLPISWNKHQRNLIIIERISSYTIKHLGVGLTNTWYANIEKSRYTATIFFNLKYAFDTVDDVTLLTILEEYGVAGREHTLWRFLLEVIY